MKFETVTFEEITINYDKKRVPLSTKQRESIKGVYRYYGAQGVIDYIDDYIFDGKYLLIAEDGENLKSKKQNIAQLAEGKFWVNNHAHIVQCNSKCRIEYLCYLINSMDLSGYITGSAQPKLSQANINKISFQIPIIEQQDLILSVLIPIEKKIKLNNQINENLEQQAQAIFKSWFVDFEPFGGVKPEEWTEKSVYDLAEYINGAAFKKNEYSTEGIPIIKIAELKNGITDSTQYCCIEKDEKYYFDNKAILFSWSGNPETSIDTFLWYRGKAILNQHTFQVVSKYNAPAFTYFLLKYLKPKFTHIASNKQTTGLGHVTVSDLKRLQFSCSTDAIEEFEKISKPLFDMIYNTYVESNRLSKLRDVLLPKLMNGEIDVSEIKI